GSGRPRRPIARERLGACARATRARAAPRRATSDDARVTAADAHDFFAASAGIAGALIGLLFVAISVAPERVLGPEASEVHGVRAVATLTAFTNALTGSLFALIPTFNVGGPATAVAIVGLLFIVRAVVGITPGRSANRGRA